MPVVAYAYNAFEQMVLREAPVQKKQANGVQLNMCTVTVINLHFLIAGTTIHLSGIISILVCTRAAAGFSTAGSGSSWK